MRTGSFASVAAAVALGIAAAPTVASAAPANEFKVSVTSAKIAVAGLPAFPIQGQQLASTPISITGTADDDGNLSAPQSGVVFPSLSIPIPQDLLTQLIGQAGTAIPPLLQPLLRNITITAAIKPSGAAQGTVSRTTGALRLDVPLTVEVGINAFLPLITCKLAGLAFSFRTDKSSLTQGSSLNGQPYDSATGKAVVSGEATVPQPTCSGLAAAFLGDALSQIAGVQLGKVGIELDSDVTLPPPAEVSLPAVSRHKISSRGQIQPRLTCSRVRNCRGFLYVKLEDGTLLVTKSFTISAGRSSTLKLTMPRTLRTRMKSAPVMIGTLRATVAGGPDVTQGISLQRPLNWR